MHAVSLIWIGYHRLTSTAFTTAEEDDITGELVREMKLAQLDPSAPEWVERYEIREQVPQNTAGKLGKRRPKMDIEFERNGRGPRPHLGFEAKRLGRGKSIGDYLGEEGLAAFLGGHYPTLAGECGMVGYIQAQSQQEWLDNLAKAFVQDAVKHCVVAGGTLELGIADASAAHHLSKHTDSNGATILAVHVLLPFV